MAEVIGFLVVVGLLIGIPVALTLAISAARRRREEERKNRIYAKYGRGEVADRILSSTIWVGETSEQLLDSIGRPADTDEKVLKTKKKEIWKYYHRGGNRYGLRITIENGVVVGWEEKL